MRRIFIYTKFERFWHWMQTALIITLAITGFEVHGSLRLLGFERAVTVHNYTAASLLILVAFAIFWHFTTGAWKQYVPTTDKISATLRYYTSGIFRNEPHPYKKTEVSRLNPLQRFTYLAFKLLIVPVMVTTGLLYFTYNRWPGWGIGLSLDAVAILHTLGAFTLIAFFLVHVYMSTTGRTVTSNIQAMVTGWEEWETESAPERQPTGAPVAGD